MEVPIPCICPPRAGGEPRHPEGDRVTFRETFPFRDAASFRFTVAQAVADDPDFSIPDFLGMAAEAYVMSGIESWSLLDEAGKPVPVSKATIRRVLLADHPEVAYLLADAADDLYMTAVVRPLLSPASTSSPPTPTAGSTSLTTGSTGTHPRPSKRSSTTTSPTDGIETTSLSPAGVSN